MKFFKNIGDDDRKIPVAKLIVKKGEQVEIGSASGQMPPDIAAELSGSCPERFSVIDGTETKGKKTAS